MPRKRKTKGFKMPVGLFPYTTRISAEEDVARLARKLPQFKFKIRRKGFLFDIWGYKK